MLSHSAVSDSVTPWTAARQAPLPSTIFQSLLRFMSMESVRLSNHLLLCFWQIVAIQYFLEEGLNGAALLFHDG